MKRRASAWTAILTLLLSTMQFAVAQADQRAAEIQPQTTAQQQRTYKHDGGRDDIDAIGNRKIGRQGLGNWYSLEKEMRLGKDYSLVVEAGAKLLRDPVVNEYVNRIGQNVVRNSDAKVPFTIKVIDSEEVNAFSVPGGHLYVNYGLLLATDDEAELAGVMAHEIAHVAARHATRQMTRGDLFSLASIALIFVGGPAGYAVQQAARIGVPLTMLKFSRGFEAEADYLGLQYLYKAGYDPQAYIAFFEKVQALDKSKSRTVTKVFSNHPPTGDRIKKCQAEIAKILPPLPQYLVSTSEFEAIKTRLLRIQNRYGPVDGRQDGPTLRRTARSAGSSENSGARDDHPTLKRRSN